MAPTLYKLPIVFCVRGHRCGAASFSASRWSFRFLQLRSPHTHNMYLLDARVGGSTTVAGWPVSARTEVWRTAGRISRAEEVAGISSQVASGAPTAATVQRAPTAHGCRAGASPRDPLTVVDTVADRVLSVAVAIDALPLKMMIAEMVHPVTRAPCAGELRKTSSRPKGGRQRAKLPTSAIASPAL